MGICRVQLAGIEIAFDRTWEVTSSDFHEIVEKRHSEHSLGIDIDALSPAKIGEEHRDQGHTKRMIGDGFDIPNAAEQPAQSRYCLEPHQFSDEADCFRSFRALLQFLFLGIGFHTINANGFRGKRQQGVGAGLVPARLRVTNRSDARGRAGTSPAPTPRTPHFRTVLYFSILNRRADRQLEQCRHDSIILNHLLSRAANCRRH